MTSIENLFSIEDLYKKYNINIVSKQIFNKDNNLIRNKHEEYKL